MGLNDYGPFANIVAGASALLAVFSLLLVKMFGRVRRWTWLINEKPPFLIKAGPQAIAVTLIALVYFTINERNYLAFGIAGLLCGVVAAMLIVRFDRLTSIHILAVPLVAANGSQAVDRKGNPLSQKIVIGSERNLRPEAQSDLTEARKQRGGLSLAQFLSGYGAQRTYDAEAAWTREQLAKDASSLTVALMGIFLFGVMGIYLAASAMEFANRQ